MKNSNTSKDSYILSILALLTAMSSLSIDMYQLAFFGIVKDLHSTVAQIALSMANVMHFCSIMAFSVFHLVRMIMIQGDRREMTTKEHLEMIRTL